MERMKLVADVALHQGERIRLVRYGDTRMYDGQEGWFLPDDYLRRGEHPEDAALRILKEQVGVALDRLDLRFVESFEGDGAWHLVFHFQGTLPKGARLRPAANTAVANWFDPTHLPERSEVAHGGWALDILRARRERGGDAIHVRSVAE